MRFRAQLLATLALVGVAACQESPSYRLRWAIIDELEMDERQMLDAATCSESGLFQVRLRAYAAPGVLADERTYPCFSTALADPEGTVGGSALPPGRYAIELRGIDRTGDPWDAEEAPSLEPGAPEPTGCSPEGDAACLPTELVCDCQHLLVVAAGSSAPASDARVVEEGETVELPEFVLVAPPQCIDGIDNDLDGLVDVGDPSCNVDFGDGSEGVPVGVTELRLELSLLDDNPAVSCASTPLRRLRLSYLSGDGDTGDAAEVVFEEPCDLEQPYLASLRLPAGPAVFTAVGLDSGGEPVTQAKTFEAEISPIGGTVQQAIDFGPEDFLEPIVQRIYVKPAYVGELGRRAIVRYSCPPEDAKPGDMGNPRDPTDDVPPIPRGLLVLDRLRVDLLNSHGGALESPAALQDGTVLDGPTEIDCTREVVTAPLEWSDGYTMTIEALSAEGEVCFSNQDTPQLMAPGEFGALFLPRVYDAEGKVPASCHDCEVDVDCGLEGDLFCVENVCQGRCATDDECLSDELGDLGLVCSDEAQDDGVTDGVCGVG